MDGSRREVEVKLRFDSAETARRAIAELGADTTVERHFEDNAVYDREDESLRASGRLIRLRRAGDSATLTFKAPVEGTHRHKVRREIELSLDDPRAMHEVLTGLDLHPGYRYQKYRTVFRLDRLSICLDETPLGCFVELEGDPESIDRVAARLGFGPDRYVLETYRELHERAARSAGRRPGPLVFESEPRTGR